MPSLRPCNCGSGEHKRAIYDAKGIFVTFVCDVCEEKKRAQYRPDIFTDSDYETEEPVDDDEPGDLK